MFQGKRPGLKLSFSKGNNEVRKVTKGVTRMTRGIYVRWSPASLVSPTLHTDQRRRQRQMKFDHSLVCPVNLSCCHALCVHKRTPTTNERMRVFSTYAWTHASCQAIVFRHGRRKTTIASTRPTLTCQAPRVFECGTNGAL